MLWRETTANQRLLTFDGWKQIKNNKNNNQNNNNMSEYRYPLYTKIHCKNWKADDITLYLNPYEFSVYTNVFFVLSRNFHTICTVIHANQIIKNKANNTEL